MKTSFDRILSVVKMEESHSGHVPLYEHFVDDEIIGEIMGFDPPEGAGGLTTLSGAVVSDEELPLHLEYWKQKLEFNRQMGYDFLSVEFPPLFAKARTLRAEDSSELSRKTRDWVDEHSGPINTLEDLDNEAFFPPLDRLYDFRLFEAISDMMPEDMKIIGGFAGGPFEHGTYLLGLEDYLMGVFQDKPLFDNLHEKLREVFVAIARKLVKIENLGILRIGDDLGYKNATMVSPQMLRKYIFPIYEEVIRISHAQGKPFILHSCGNLEEVMDDLIDTCKVDAKHSNEDVIAPFEEIKERWGDRIALLGGVDVDFLARQTPEKIKEKVKYLIDRCAGKGFALGSGNTVPDYVPIKNYLAMIETAREASA